MSLAAWIGKTLRIEIERWINRFVRQTLGVSVLTLLVVSSLSTRVSPVAAQTDRDNGGTSSSSRPQAKDPPSNEALELAEQQAFQQAVAVVAPSVVQIETFGGLDRLEDRSQAEGPTTGTVIGEEGWIITSMHGLHQQPASILVNLPDGSRSPARIAARDFSREIALLKVETSVALPVVVASDPTGWQVGQWSIAIGKTYDTQSVTQSYGILSALGRAYGRAVQTDAKVSPINYGGPLIDLYGRVIGILAPVPGGEMIGEDGSVLYDSGVGFAVPLTDILQRLESMQAGQDVRAGKLGVVTKDQNEMAGPVILSGAAPGSPAAKAGVQAGDIIVRAQGQPVELLADLRHLLSSVDAGQVFEFEVQRGTERIELQCNLVAEIPVYRRRYLGIRLKSVENGLEIQSVIQSSPAATAGMEVGQLITGCNGKSLASPNDLGQLLAVADLDHHLEFKLRLADGKSDSTVQVLPAEWPTHLIEHQPAAIPRDASNGPAENGGGAQMVELKLADIPNKIHALIPQNAAERQLGCLLIYCQPGEVSTEKVKANWQRLATDYGWLVVFPESSNPQSWSRDETELASRLLTRLDQEYSLDRMRTVLGGIGAGGQLAILAALMEKERVSGVLTLGTSLRPLPLRQPSAPLQTLDFLLIGESRLEAVAEQLNRMGYVANAITAEVDPEKWETVPVDSMIRWLEIIGYF